MKKAEDWLRSFGEIMEEDNPTTNVTAEDIELIQLDAYKQGMMDALNEIIIHYSIHDMTASNIIYRLEEKIKNITKLPS